MWTTVTATSLLASSVFHRIRERILSHTADANVAAAPGYWSAGSESRPGHHKGRRPDSEQHRTWLDGLLLSLFRTFPPKETIFKEPGPRSEREYRQECDFGFHRWFGLGTELFVGKDVLDVGSGFGGRPVRYAEYGARTVTGLEISDELSSYAHAFASSKRAPKVRFVTGIGEKLPFQASQFDLITMFDVMEHVVSPREVLKECWRVLRPNGLLATVFPPYYHLRAGSHLEGYATTLPGLNLVFPTRVLKRAAVEFLEENEINYFPFVREVPTDKLWNMNGLTVRGFKRLVGRSQFKPELLRCLGDLDHRVTGFARRLRALRRPPFSWVTVVPAQVPLLQEAFCLRVCALLRKSSSGSPSQNDSGAMREGVSAAGLPPVPR